MDTLIEKGGDRMKKYFIFLSVLVMSFVILLGSYQQVSVSANEIPLTSKSYILIDTNSGTILAAKNEHEKLPVASICKLMTSLITLERIEAGSLSLEDEIVASPYASSMEGSQAFLDAGSSYKVKDLLKSVIVASANDSSVVLAEGIAGSEQSFTKLMNERALQLGMNNTVYVNSNGLPAMGQHSSAYDTSILLKEVSQYDLYLEYSRIWMDELEHPSGRKTELVNTNRLIKYYDKCISGKTGFTDEAGYCLASHANNGKLDLIAVVLQCDKITDRFDESVQLYNYGFANFDNKKVVDASAILPDTYTVKNAESVLEVRPEKDYYILTKKGDSKEVELEININYGKAPIHEGEKCGTITIIDNGVVLEEINLIANNTIEPRTFKEALGAIKDRWMVK